MPATVRKIKRRWRVVEPDGRLVKNRNKTPVDGGGHESKQAAQKQAAAVNSKSKRREHGKEINATRSGSARGPTPSKKKKTRRTRRTPKRRIFDSSGSGL